jgi:acyl carrier protein phosphodiesterase
VNHLAHIHLAGPDPDVQLGGLIADFWRGAPDLAWPERVRAGVVLHRKIDVYTDSHPEVARLRASFDAPFRRYAGILLDMYFDHALARIWPSHASESIEAVSARAIDLVAANEAWVPAELVRFAHYMRRHDLFAGYARRETIEHALGGIGRRLKRANPLQHAGAVLWQKADALDRGFARFFPELADVARARRSELNLAG